MLNSCECECEEERKSLKASSMQLTSARNIQFGFACKVPLTRFNFLANFQSWGINLNSSCIIPILSICRGRQESASGPGYGNKNVDTEQIRRPLPPHDGSSYLIECNCGNCFLVAVHKNPVPGCNQCRHINIITGVSGEVSGYQCLGVFRSWPGGGGRCSLRLQRDEWCSYGVKTVQQCTVSPGEGHMFHLFPVCLPWISLQMYKRMLGCHLNVTLPWSPPRLATSDPGYLFCEFSHHPTRHRPAAGVRSHGRAAEFHRYPSPFSPPLVLALGGESS